MTSLDAPSDASDLPDEVNWSHFGAEVVNRIDVPGEFNYDYSKVDGFIHALGSAGSWKKLPAEYKAVLEPHLPEILRILHLDRPNDDWAWVENLIKPTPEAHDVLLSGPRTRSES